MGGTTSIVVTGANKPDPTGDWNYTTADQQPTLCPHCPAGTLSFFSAISWANPENQSDPTVLLFGHDDSCDREQMNCTLLARGDFNKLALQDWQGLAFWTKDGWSDEPYSAAAMQPLNVPSWETTLQWDARLRLWYTFDRGSFGADINLWTAVTPTAVWEKTAVYSIPAPFDTTSDPHQNESWLCYAAKAHPELQPPAESAPGRTAASRTHDIGEDALGQPMELVFSFICNSFGHDDDDTREKTHAQEFQAGGMSLRPTKVAPIGARGYWPRFVRVFVERTGSSTDIDQPSQFVI